MTRWDLGVLNFSASLFSLFKRKLGFCPLDLIFLYRIILIWEDRFLWIWNAIVSIRWHYRNYPAYLISTSQLNQSNGVVWKQAAQSNADDPAFQGSVHHCFSLSLTRNWVKMVNIFFLCKTPLLLYTFVVNIVTLCIISLYFCKWTFLPIVSASVPLSSEGWGEGEWLVWSLIPSWC